MKKLLILESQEDLQARRQLFLRALTENGYVAKVILWNRTRGRPVLKEQYGIEFESIAIPAKYADVRSAFKIFHLYCAFFRKIMNENPDVIFCGHFFLLPLAVVAAKLKSCKLFYDVMEYYVHNFFERVPKLILLLRPIVYLMENRLVKACDGVTTIPSNGSFLFQRLRSKNLNVEEVKNVPFFTKENAESERKDILFRLPNGKRVFLYAGTISEEWGIMKLLQAILIVKERYPEITLLVLGKTRHEYEHVVFKFLEENGLSDNVNFPGFVVYESLFGYLRTVYAGIVPMQPVSKFQLVGNGTSRKVFEYMNAGIPVIASEFGELAQAVREEKCGILVDTTKPEEIARAIIYLLEHSEEANEMGNRGRKAIEEKYNWNIEREKLLRVFDRLWN